MRELNNVWDLRVIRIDDRLVVMVNGRVALHRYMAPELEGEAADAVVADGLLAAMELIEAEIRRLMK